MALALGGACHSAASPAVSPGPRPSLALGGWATVCGLGLHVTLTGSAVGG